ncbi:hypothetical protein CR105_05800 [Massilia eurypsychrophila]|uniref:DUF3305 domain-containing protein n=1 Tax=Massilia eurypsychrophila TaxID=1485217 RepID=A0A2G8THV6_9BURK|nr:DUF3305 domain-containing protein [Massilia eurypsychrophila]PIL45603.1 hypothetical protein CR105_05800 [Massilia eurypsychrophila]
MQLASLPIAVIMQRRVVQHRWADEVWSAIAVLTDPGGLPPMQPLPSGGGREAYLVSGLELQLYPDENDGYFENWIAPESKVFVMWRMQEGRAMPLKASVSYAEGTRMFDSGEAADGVAMPPDIHNWLAGYLREHYQPRDPGERHGRRARRQER